MNAWLESGRTGTFANVRQDDVVIRTSSQFNSLILGNGLNPYAQAAVYLTSNCIGINRVPDTTSAAATHIVLDVGGVVACRAGMTWCDPDTPSRAAEDGSNALRASVSGIVLNDGTNDTINLARDGLMWTSGMMCASNARFAVCTASNAEIEVLSVTGGMVVDGTMAVTGQVVAPGYRLLSDVRLKRGVVQTDTAADTKALLAMDVKRYALADNGGTVSNANKTRRHMGVLAQDLASVMPEAVTLVDDYLPDIMSRAHVDADAPLLNMLTHMRGHGHGHGRARGTWIVFPLTFVSHEFKVGDNLRLRLGRMTLTADVIHLDPQDVRRVCLEGRARNSPLSSVSPGTELFVYGTLSHEVMAIDTTHVLFSLVSAVQDLHARVMALDASAVPPRP